MRNNFLVVLVIFNSLILAGQAAADPCVERFKFLMSAPNWDVPMITKFSSQTNGGAITKGQTTSASWDHQLTVQEDANIPQALNYKGGIFLSYDQGKNWQKINALDPEKMRTDTVEGLKKNAETSTNVTCREEVLNGQSVDVVEGDLENVWPAKNEAHYVLYTPKGSDFVIRNESTIKISKSITSVVISDVEKIDKLDLPTPE